MRRIVVKKNGKTFLVTVNGADDPIIDAGPGTGSAPYILPFVEIQGSFSATQSVHSGSTLVLTGAAGPVGPFDYMGYQWQSGSNKNLVDGAHYTGSLSSYLTIFNTTVAQTGIYELFVRNQYGSATSSLVYVSVI